MEAFEEETLEKLTNIREMASKIEENYKTMHLKEVFSLAGSAKGILDELLPNLESQSLIYDARSIIESAREIKAKVDEPENMLEQAIAAFNEKDYETANNQAMTARQHVINSMKALSSKFIQWSEGKIKALQDNKMDTPKLHELYDGAQEAVGQEDYAKAITDLLDLKAEMKRIIEHVDELKKRVTGAKERHAEERKQFTMTRANYIKGCNEFLESYFDIIGATISSAEEKLVEKDFDKTEEFCDQIDSTFGNLDLFRETAVSLKKAEDEIATLETAGLHLMTAKEILDQAVQAANNAKFDSAKELETQALEEAQKSKMEHDAQDVITRVENAMALLTKREADVSAVNDVLSSVKSAFEGKDFEATMSAAGEALEKLKGIAESIIFDISESAMGRLQDAQKVVATGEPEGFFFEAQSALEEDDFLKGVELFEQFDMALAKSLEGGDANISIEFENKNLPPNTWSREIIFVINAGKVHAKNVQLDISGPVQVMRLNPIGLLPAEDKVEMEIAIHFKGAGSIPLDVGFKYENALNNEKCESKSQLWVDVGT